ncbi:MAG: patatin-like phospholipase family protein, partial [Acidimicrobiia bacterium]
MTTAFVLGGGGRWGAVEVGMLRALDEEGLLPDLVLGTSIGAFNGSVIADRPGPEGVARLADLWAGIA